jgi:hypothetical protein
MNTDTIIVLTVAGIALLWVLAIVVSSRKAMRNNEKSKKTKQ